MSAAGPDTAAPLVARAFDGPLDVVGDVHGEVEALDDLLRVLGYRGRGEHPAGRRLVFIGDICDRGPDSPEVVRRVAAMVAEGTAQCLLGNHELNVLRGKPKEGNGWFFADDHDRREGKFPGARPPADDAERTRILDFFATLPIALEREDLRLVHALWDEPRIDSVRQASGRVTALELHAAASRDCDERWSSSGKLDELEALRRRYGPSLRDPDAVVPRLDLLAEADVDHQASNPVRVLTSGLEQRVDAPFYLAGKWRMVDRVDWWERYDDPVHVLFGHYWRWPSPAMGARMGTHARNAFPAYRPHEWLGRAGRAYCVDFCVGARYVERLRYPGEPCVSRLGAVRWPEREVVFDDGRGAELALPARQD